MPADANPDILTLEWKKGFPTLDGDYYSRIDEYDKQPTVIRIESRTSETAAAVYEFGCEKDLRREYESEDYEYLGPIDAPALCATVRALRAGGLTMQTAYDKATGELRQQNTALREQLAQSQAEVERFSTLADEERDAQIGTWDEFVAKFNKKYPRLPLYDTENCKRYVQRAVKFIAQGHVD